MEEDLSKLIEIANSNEESGESKVTDDILTFLVNFNVKTGKFKIRTNVLYSIYKNWSKDPKSNQKFSSYLGKIVHLDNGGNCYISVSSIKLHEDLYRYLSTKSRPKEKVRNYKTHFESFLKYYGFKPGDFFIKESSIYYLYDKWVYKNKNRKPLNEPTILKFCSIYLTSKTTKQNKKLIRYLGINRDEMTTTLEQLEFAAKWNDIRHEKKRKSKKYG